MTSWRKYLSEDEDNQDVENIRKGTMQGKAFGSAASIDKIEKDTGLLLKVLERGRPSKS